MLSTPTLIFTHLDSLFSWQKGKENRSFGEWELNSLTWGANSSRPIFAFLSSYPCLLLVTLRASLGAVCSHSIGPNGLDRRGENRSSAWTLICRSSCGCGEELSVHLERRGTKWKMLQRCRPLCEMSPDGDWFFKCWHPTPPLRALAVRLCGEQLRRANVRALPAVSLLYDMCGDIF